MDIEIQDPAEEEAKEEETDDAADKVESEEESVAEDEAQGEGDGAEPDPVPPIPKDPEAKRKAEVEKWRELAVRNQADLENYRKRMAREKSEAVQYANVSLLRSLLPILDNFEMGLEAAKAESEDSVIYQGMAMVRKQVEEFLSDEGVEVMGEVGAAFDPNLHEAVQQEWSEDDPEGEIIGVVRRGYRMGERLLRPANVIVSKGPQPEGNSEESEAPDEEAD